METRGVAKQKKERESEQSRSMYADVESQSQARARQPQNRGGTPQVGRSFKEKMADEMKG